MFLGHLPAGYLLTHWLQKKLKTQKFLWAGLFASVFPDIDMLYFYSIDDRQTLHHHYWTHLPLFWIALGVIALITAKLFKQRNVFLLTTIIISNILLHLVLDSTVGGINWLYPFIDYDLFFFTVPDRYDFWIWNFIFHWTFLFEVGLLAAALLLLRRSLHQEKKAM